MKVKNTYSRLIFRLGSLYLCPDWTPPLVQCVGGAQPINDRCGFILFGQKISKSQQLSNWEAEQLTQPQQLYAATDAWACLTIYNRLQELKQTGDYVIADDEPVREPSQAANSNAS